jgi:F0F1-type ATP synthase assembly protein I
MGQSSVYGSIFVFLPKNEYYILIVKSKSQTVNCTRHSTEPGWCVVQPFLQGSGLSAVCSSVIFTRLRTICHLWFSHFYRAQDCQLSVVQPFLQGSGLSAVCGSAIFTRLRTLCCLWFSHFYKAQDCLLSVVRPFLHGSGLSAICGSAIFTRLRTVCCLCGSFICASHRAVSVCPTVQPFLCMRKVIWKDIIYVNGK